MHTLNQNNSQFEFFNKYLGTNLNSELYYKIKCNKENGYCLHVANCTVKSDDENMQPYHIIDENGCTLEPSLFEHVQVRYFNVIKWLVEKVQIVWIYGRSNNLKLAMKILMKLFCSVEALICLKSNLTCHSLHCSASN